MADIQQSFGSSYKSAGPSMSLIDNKQSVGVGNYKGVMLCNRPFAGSVDEAGKKTSGEKTSFSCGVVADPAGTNVSISSYNEKIHIKRPKKETALTKHRKWLQELQKTKDRLEQQYLEEQQKKIESQQKFAEREAKIRAMARESYHQPESSDKENTAQAEAKETPSISKPETQEKKATKAKTNKPAWALTEDKAESATDEKMFEDEDDLLNFASGLDFEKYIDDLEVHTMMERVKKRITELEREVSEEQKREADSEARGPLRLKLEAKEGGHAELTQEEKDEYAAAKELLSEADELKGIHSQRSAAAIYRQAKDKEDDGPPRIINQPKIVTHEESEGARMEIKNNPSNLPYIHRNPAV